VLLDITTAKGNSKAVECATLQMLRELEDGWEAAKPLDCAAYPRFGLARSARRQQLETCHKPRCSRLSQNMNRIVDRFARLKQDRKKGLIAYIGAGDPNLEATRQLGLAFDRAGVDVLELGVPFSDPLADGLVNQLAAQRGLESGSTPPKVLETAAAIRRDSQIPIVLYIYFNLLHRCGVERFIQDAARAGVDGLLVLDLPPEESGNYEALMKQAGLCNIYLVAPTTPEDRIELIVKRATGFIYYVSREGVTGMQARVAGSIGERVAQIRAHTDLPVAVGFGISTPEQARTVAASAEGAVVGSAIVNQIAQHGSSPDLVRIVSDYVASLVNAVKQA
jgi:tryptophan synthase alpha chain